MKENHATQERRDADVFSIFWIAALLIIAGVVTVLLTAGVFHFFLARRNAADRPPSQLAEQRADFPAPRLQVAPPEDLQKMLAREKEELNSYGWMDREHGVVRLPIQRAMELLSQR